MLANLGLLAWVGAPLIQQAFFNATSSPSAPSGDLPASSPTETPAPLTTEAPPQPVAAQPSQWDADQGVMILSLSDGVYRHLYAYHPLALPLTQVTHGDWDDITPSVSPDGKKLAYASRQNGYWDLYLLDLESGEIIRLTDTPEYDGAPTWSPDGQWLAYESFSNNNLEIFVRPAAPGEAAPQALTNHPAADSAPVWSPNGREIAFVSNRSGDQEIWVARLDQVDDRLTNVSRRAETQDSAPAWSGDGQLLWTANQLGVFSIIQANLNETPIRPQAIAEGAAPLLTPGGGDVVALIPQPTGASLTAFNRASGQPSLPPTALPAAPNGITWVPAPLPAWLAQTAQTTIAYTKPVLWEPQLTAFPIAPVGRQAVVPLTDVSAPYPMLHDAVDEAFMALRVAAATQSGWDALATLENAYVPLSDPLAPGQDQDWHYTGRAFSLNPLLLSAGWIAITREDYAGQTYWRVYLKARFQDGSAGEPIRSSVWDVNARLSGDTQAYEQGGAYIAPPAGYWIDFTAMSQAYGWERLPAQPNWRTYFQALRYNTFVMRDGLDWMDALEQIYPIEALSTATPLPTYTPSATPTFKGTGAPPTITPTPTITLTPTFRPTWTARP